MKSKKIFTEFNKDKHVVTLDPELLAHAEQKGGVLIMTDTTIYRLEKVRYD